MASEFRPGFRLSTTDALVLIAGAVGTIAAWRIAPEFAGLMATAILHFFLFCNVLRVARRPELWWSGLFLAFVLAHLALGVPWLVVTGLVAATTTAVTWHAVRQPSYHGVLWQQLNPGLPAFWSSRPQPGQTSTGMPADLLQAHAKSSNHRDALDRAGRCGCFHCCAEFTAAEITDWVDAPADAEAGTTALCPRCGIDSVIPLEPGMDAALLRRMKQSWF